MAIRNYNIYRKAEELRNKKCQPTRPGKIGDQNSASPVFDREQSFKYFSKITKMPPACPSLNITLIHDSSLRDYKCSPVCIYLISHTELNRTYFWVNAHGVRLQSTESGKEIKKCWTWTLFFCLHHDVKRKQLLNHFIASRLSKRRVILLYKAL